MLEDRGPHGGNLRKVFIGRSVLGLAVMRGDLDHLVHQLAICLVLDERVDLAVLPDEQRQPDGFRAADFRIGSPGFLPSRQQHNRVRAGVQVVDGIGKQLPHCLVGQSLWGRITAEPRFAIQVRRADH